MDKKSPARISPAGGECLSFRKVHRSFSFLTLVLCYKVSPRLIYPG